MDPVMKRRLHRYQKAVFSDNKERIESIEAGLTLPSLQLSQELKKFTAETARKIALMGRMTLACGRKQENAYNDQLKLYINCLEGLAHIHKKTANPHILSAIFDMMESGYLAKSMGPELAESINPDWLEKTKGLLKNTEMPGNWKYEQFSQELLQLRVLDDELQVTHPGH